MSTVAQAVALTRVLIRIEAAVLGRVLIRVETMAQPVARVLVVVGVLSSDSRCGRSSLTDWRRSP